MARRFLSWDEARAFYDRFGARQDSQGFYEGPAGRELIRHGGFEAATAVFEFGCGTGAFARELLAHRLPASASYLGIDISSTMVRLARERLSAYEARARVALTGGSPVLAAADGAFDRFVANYVLDLLPPEDIEALLREAHRILKPEGRLCLTSLTRGRTPVSAALTWAWDRVHRLNPRWVGGCRPIELRDYLLEERWRIDFQRIVSAFAIPSEVVVATRRGGFRGSPNNNRRDP